MQTKRFGLLAAFCAVFLLPGCAGFGIVASSDPLVKLNDAEDLFERQGRPLPAERLIREALAIYEERRDFHGLGNANREYGDLLHSPSIKKWEHVYRRDGFQDRSITFDNRLEKAAEFYRKAIAHYEQAAQQELAASKFDALTNGYFNIGWSYYRLGQRDKTCLYYNRAIDAAKENIRLNPSAKPLSPGSPTVFDYLANEKRRAECP